MKLAEYTQFTVLWGIAEFFPSKRKLVETLFTLIYRLEIHLLSL